MATFPAPVTSNDVPQEIIYVRQASDLGGTLDSTKLYFIDGFIDMGTTSIVVPEDGLNIKGHGFGISGLFSTADNFDLFITNATTYSGDLFLTGMDIRISGTGSRCFFLDNQENSNAVEWDTVNFIACTDLGEITSYRQGLNRNVAWISCKKGITMSGSWAGGWAALDSIVVGAPMTDTLFKAGSGLLINGSFRSNLNILGIGSAGGSLCDFSPSNFLLDGGFTLSSARGNPAVNNLPNMPATSTKANISDCVGLPNTYPGMSIIASNNAVVGIQDQNTLYQISNTVDASQAYWCSVANTNGAQFDSTQDLEAVVTGSLSFSGSNNREIGIQLRQWDDSASAYVNIGPEFSATLNGGASSTRAENVAIQVYTSLSQNDRIEVWVKNKTDSSEVTLVTGSTLGIFKR